MLPFEKDIVNLGFDSVDDVFLRVTIWSQLYVIYIMLDLCRESQGDIHWFKLSRENILWWSIVFDFQCKRIKKLAYKFKYHILEKNGSCNRAYIGFSFVNRKCTCIQYLLLIRRWLTDDVLLREAPIFYWAFITFNLCSPNSRTSYHGYNNTSSIYVNVIIFIRINAKKIPLLLIPLGLEK